MEDEDSASQGGLRGGCVRKEQTAEIIVLEKLSLTISLSWMKRQRSFEIMRLKFTGIVAPHGGPEFPFSTRKNQGFLEK